MANDITPTHQQPAPTLDGKVRELLGEAHDLAARKLVEARSEDGMYFRRDPATGHVAIAHENILVEERDHTVTVVFTKPGATRDGVVRDMAGRSQKAIGAVVGESQQSVSERARGLTGPRRLS